jgi:pimeloyl-ACP methyl ester carboxylesterase
MQRHFFEYEGSRLHYLKYLGGEKIMLAFHGYGQDAQVFHEISTYLTNGYTVYSFDLFFHGRSTWNKTKGEFSKNELETIFNMFLGKENISEFSVMAFSLGGKTALCLAELYPEKIEKLILIAPDGIKTSFWYNLATYPGPIRSLFRYIIFSPKLFFQLASLLYHLKFANE